MARLQFYTLERLVYHEIWNCHFFDAKAKVVAKKILRHFGITRRIQPEIFFRGKRDSGTYYGHAIRFSHNPSLGIIIHECAHKIEQSKYGKTRHGYRLARIMDRIIKYAKKKGWFLT